VKKILQTIIVSISIKIVFASNIDLLSLLQEQQKLLSEEQHAWSRHYAPVSGTLKSANSNEDLEKEFSSISLSTRPHPEIYSFYLRDDTEKDFQLVQDPATSSIRIVRLYGPTEEGLVNYVTMSTAPTARETLSHTRSATYSEKRKKGNELRKKRSTSYPEGCLAYNYTVKSGSSILLNRGHGTDHSDTSEHPGLLSTRDPENYTPQNEFYNGNVRGPLVEKLRSNGQDYKEISIYHRDHDYHVEDHANISTSCNVPLPEGFVFLVFNKETSGSEVCVQEAYYFPNLINYTEITPTSLPAGQTLFDYFCNLFQIKEEYFKEWFWNPAITLGDTDSHLEQLNLAEYLTEKLLALSHFYFKDFSEEQIPPKARAALLSSLLEWNAQAAATLEFIGLEQQLNLVHLYRVSRNFYELDARYTSEKMQEMKKFLKDQSVSETASDIVQELFEEIQEKRLSFLQTQQALQSLIHYIQEIEHNDPDYWENAKPFLEPVEDRDFLQTFGTPYLIDVFCPDHKTIKIDGFSHSFRLSTLKPKTDLKALTELVGGFNIRDMDKAEKVLEIVESRARTIQTTIQDKLAFVAFYSDADKFPCSAKAEEWEGVLKAQIEEGTSLLEKRQIADFYGLRNIREKQVFWLEQLVKQLDREPTIENFLAIAHWCGQPTGAFLQETNETTDHFVRSGSFTLGLNIYAALIFNKYEEVKRISPGYITEYLKKLVMIDNKTSDWLGIIFPLEAFSTDDEIIMEMLKKIETSILKHFPIETVAPGLRRV